MKKFSTPSFSLSSILRSFLSFLMISALVFSIGGCGKEKEEVEVKEVVRPVKMLTLEGKGSTKKTKYPGRVRANQRVDLAFQVAGPLIELLVTEGQRIKKGELIARILPRDFETEISKAQAKSLDAEQQFQRYRDLYVKKQVSKADFDKYKSQADIARARLKETEDSLSDTYLKAPFTGVIAKRYVENFEDVKAKDPIVSIQDISEVEILIDVPEKVMITLRKDARKNAVAEFAATPGKQYPLSLKEFSTEADPRTQTYR
jgi:multidrug efflux system membrane fusion protein